MLADFCCWFLGSMAGILAGGAIMYGIYYRSMNKAQKNTGGDTDD